MDLLSVDRSALQKRDAKKWFTKKENTINLKHLCNKKEHFLIVGKLQTYFLNFNPYENHTK